MTNPVIPSTKDTIHDPKVGHKGEIRGALGTISHQTSLAGSSYFRRFRTLLAILGPGLIVMSGDNDAGAFAIYTHAGQNYGTALLWTLLLLVPIIYINQEMVLRLGAVSGVGHARLIFERFGKFWGAFSIIDLFLLNALTIVTEFVGISLGLDYLGIPKLFGVAASAAIIMLTASTGDFRRFERFTLFLVFGSLLLIPLFLMVHPSMSRMAYDFFIPGIPKGGNPEEILLLIIAIVGTTIAPWQLFFQQSYVIDKRITARFIKYLRIDLWIGIVIVVAGASAMMGISAFTFAGHPESGMFTDAGAVASGIAKYHGHVAGILFAIALIDACIVGASAVSLSTAYALGDMFSVGHSLHKKPAEALGFYAFFFGLIILAVVLVTAPGVPLGLLTNLVQTLAGVLLPSATVFLLLLCNDKAVLGPWVNSRSINIFTAAIIAILVLLSAILTASELFPAMSGKTMVKMMIAGIVIGSLTALSVRLFEKPGSLEGSREAEIVAIPRDLWRMPPLDQLPPAKLSLSSRVWMIMLRSYLGVAGGLLLYKLIHLAIFGAAKSG